MAENNNEYVPQLTLDPTTAAPAADVTLDAVDTKPLQPAPEEEKEELSLSQLSEAEQKAVLDFAEKIDITDTNLVLQYGSAAQKNMADFSSSALNNVRTKDMGAVGDMLGDLVVELKGFDYNPEEKKGFFGLFKKAQNAVASLKAQYDKAEVNVNKIAAMLEDHQVVLLKDIALLDKMYEMNLGYFKELTMYILSGKERLKKAQEVELPALQKKAEESGLPEDSQAASDFASMCNRFDKKLHDLELTRMVSLQMGPQIRLIQNNDSMMVEKIQSSLVNTIPLWKSQMVLALGLSHAQQAISAQREVTNVTNELLKKNAETLKMGTMAAAQEAERGIVDIETLQHTNQLLIDTLTEVKTIQEEGSRKRREAETELGRIEGELKQKLLELSNS